jgi:Spy/CpxP family protein refolding chaperone
MNRKTIITVLAVLAIVFTASAVLAGPGWGRRGGGWGPGSCPGGGYGQGYGQGYSQQAPALSAEQQEKLAELQQKHYGAMNDLRGELFEKRSALDALLNDPEASSEDVDKAVSELNEVRNEMFEERVKFRKQVADETGVQTPTGRFGRGGYGQGFCPGAQVGQGYGRGYGRGSCPGANYGGGRGYHGPRRP